MLQCISFLQVSEWKSHGYVSLQSVRYLHSVVSTVVLCSDIA